MIANQIILEFWLIFMSDEILELIVKCHEFYPHYKVKVL